MNSNITANPNETAEATTVKGEASTIRTVLQSAYGLTDCLMMPIRRGTMNRGYRVEAKSEAYFLKSYATRFYQPEQIRRTCEVQRLVKQAGLPTPGILLNSESDAVTVTETGFYVLTEFASGQECVRGEVVGEGASQMGIFLAHLQHLLTSLGDPAVLELPNPGEAAARLQRLLTLAEAQSERVETDAIACRLLRYKLEALDRQTALFSEMQGLPAQWVHGDYQVSNLVFSAEGQVSAILDFDQLQRRPRGLEMMRALDFSFSHDQILEQPGIGFFRGYAGAAAQTEAPLTEEEVRLFAPLWTYYWLVRPWPLDMRYERPEDYDPRWDALIQPPSDWWERNIETVTGQFLKTIKRASRKIGVIHESTDEEQSTAHLSQ